MALLGVFEGLALWSDTAAIWFAVAVNAAALLTAATLWRSRRFWPWIAAQLLAVLIYLPWLPTFMRQLHNGSASWVPSATIAASARTLTDFGGSYERSRLESLLVLVLLAVWLGVAYLGNTLPERKEDYRAAAAVVAERSSTDDLILYAPPGLVYPSPITTIARTVRLSPSTDLRTAHRRRFRAATIASDW